MLKNNAKKEPTCYYLWNDNAGSWKWGKFDLGHQQFLRNIAETIFGLASKDSQNWWKQLQDIINNSFPDNSQMIGDARRRCSTPRCSFSIHTPRNLQGPPPHPTLSIFRDPSVCNRPPSSLVQLFPIRRAVDNKKLSHRSMFWLPWTIERLVHCLVLQCL